MTLRGHLAGLLALALSISSLSAGEAPPKPAEPKAPAPAPKQEPPPPQEQPPKPPADDAEAKAERRERLGQLYTRAEALFAEGRMRDAQKLYAQIALEQPNYRRVPARLRAIRAQLQEEERRARQAQIDRLLEVADTRFEATDFAAAAKACEAVLAIEPKNRRAQRRLAECAGELELRRRVGSIVATPPKPAPERTVVAQAPTALATPPKGAPKAPPKDPAPVVRQDTPPAPHDATGTRVVRPGENIVITETPGAPGPEDADADGRRRLREAWDLCESAKIDETPRPVLHKALDTLAPITATSGHSTQTRQTAAMLRRSISRRLARDSRLFTPEEEKAAQLHQRYLEAEELFRKNQYEECLSLTRAILDEDRHFGPARTLNQEARLKLHDEEMEDKDLEHQMAFNKQMAEVEAFSVPHEPPPSVGRPAIDLSRPVYEVASPELEEKLNQRVSVNLIEAELDYFLDLLFRSTGVNIIYNPEVVADKTITVHIANYPLRQLLDYIARNHGLMFATTRDGVLITTPDEPRLESFIIPLNYGLIDVEEPPPSNAVAQQGGAPVPLTPPMTSNVEKLLANLPQLIEWPQGSFFYLERKMNLLYVRTTRDAYQEVVRLLDPVDQIPIQVFIRTLFVEIDQDDFESSGINFTLNARCSDKLIPRLVWDSTAGVWAETLNPDNAENVRGGTTSEGSLNLGGESYGEESSNPAITISGVFDRFQFETTIDALQRTGNARILSAPNVICVNNSSAVMSVTKTLVYVEDYEVDRADISGTSYGNTPYYNPNIPNQQQTQNYGRLSSEPVITPVFAEDKYTGFTLDVAPSVGRDTRYITLTLNPRISEEVLPRVSFELLLPTTAGAQVVTGDEPAGYERVTVERPIIAERALSTKLTVADGSIVALGGLIQQKKQSTGSKVPILGDIPILGYLFSNRAYRDKKTNLIIFVQAEIITPTGARYTDSGDIDTTMPRTTAAGNSLIRVEERVPPVVRPAPQP